MHVYDSAWSRPALVGTLPVTRNRPLPKSLTNPSETVLGAALEAKLLSET